MEEKDDAMSEVVAALVSSNGDTTTEAETESEKYWVERLANATAEKYTDSEKVAEEREALAKEPVGVQVAYEFLGRKGVTLWADFIIANHRGRLRAARWLAQEVAGIEMILRSSWSPR